MGEGCKHKLTRNFPTSDLSSYMAIATLFVITLILLLADLRVCSFSVEAHCGESVDFQLFCQVDSNSPTRMSEKKSAEPRMANLIWLRNLIFTYSQNSMKITL